MSFSRCALMGAVVLATAACGSHGDQMPARDAEAPPLAAREPDTAGRQPAPEPGGWLVPGSEVFVPQRASPGESVQGRAPVGSRVEFEGDHQVVPQQGSFSLRVPRDAHGSLPVRIERPGGRVLVLRIQVGADPVERP